jgi:hypothetical protein
MGLMPPQPASPPSNNHFPRFEQRSLSMPILLWLLGLPISLILVLMLLGAA